MKAKCLLHAAGRLVRAVESLMLLRLALSEVEGFARQQNAGSFMPQASVSKMLAEGFVCGTCKKM